MLLGIGFEVFKAHTWPSVSCSLLVDKSVALSYRHSTFHAAVILYEDHDELDL